MLNLIKAEFYQLKVRLSPKIWLLMSIFISMAIVIVPYLFENNFSGTGGIPSYFLAQAYAEFATSMAVYFLLGLTLTTFNNDIKHRTIVNSASIGYSRTKIYFSKFISSLTFALIFLALSFLTFALVIQFFYPTDFSSLVEMIVVDKFLAYLPIWLAYLALYIAILFVSDGTMPITVLMIILIMSPLFLNLASYASEWIKAIRPYVLTELNPDVALSVFGIENASYIVAFIYFIVFTFVGLTLFKRKEIK